MTTPTIRSTTQSKTYERITLTELRRWPFCEVGIFGTGDGAAAVATTKSSTMEVMKWVMNVHSPLLPNLTDDRPENETVHPTIIKQGYTGWESLKAGGL
jgi:hypothetical protein